jgi:hypothetical protein
MLHTISLTTNGLTIAYEALANEIVDLQLLATPTTPCEHIPASLKRRLAVAVTAYQSISAEMEKFGGITTEEHQGNLALTLELLTITYTSPGAA